MTRWGIAVVVVALGLCTVAGGGAASETELACSVCTFGFGHVNSVAFSPDGPRLASGSLDRSVALWDVATGERLHTLAGHGDWVRAIAFSPDGAILASGSDDGAIRLWVVGEDLIQR